MSHHEKTNSIAIDRQDNLKDIFFRNPAMMLLVEASDGKIVMANHQFLKVFKYEGSDILGEKPSDLNLWDNNKNWPKMISEMSINGHINCFMARMRDKENNIISVLWVKKKISNDQGDYILKVGVDVTPIIEESHLDRRQQKSALELVQALNHGLVVLDFEGRIIFNNSGFESMLDYEPNGLVGMSIYKIMRDNASNYKLYQFIGGLARGRVEPESGSATLIKKDGMPLELRVDWNYRQDEHGRVIGSVAMFTDITQQKAKIKALAESEKHFSDMAINFPETIYETDNEARITFANRAACRQFGYDYGASEMPVNALDLVATEDREIAWQNIQKVLNGVEVGMQEYKCRRKDGTTFVGMVHYSAISKDDIAVGLRGFVIDISKRKKIEQRVEEAKKQLEIQIKKRTRKLKEANIALKVLLENREREKNEIQDSLAVNIGQVIRPMLERLKVSGLNSKQSNIIQLLEGMIDQIVSPYSKKIANNNLSLTPAEIEVATLLKQGLSNKEIAKILNVSYNAIAFHRQNLRKKLGIKGKKINIISYLHTLE